MPVLGVIHILRRSVLLTPRVPTTSGVLGVMGRSALPILEVLGILGRTALRMLLSFVFEGTQY